MPGNPTADAWKLRFGATFLGDETAEFRVWAPNLKRLAVRILGSRPRTVSMTPSANPGESEFVAVVPQISEGTDYLYLLEGERERPDPVSRWQPHGVHGPSRVVNPESFEWSDQNWSGIPLKELII